MESQFFVIKRDDGKEAFSVEKIAEAIFKAAQSQGGTDSGLSLELAKKVQEKAREKYKDRYPNVEEVQDLVEKVLIENNHSRTAKAYILYRDERSKLRDYRTAILGQNVKDDLSLNALKMLKDRFLRRDETGKIVEMPEDMFYRVAKYIASAEKKFEKDPEPVQQQFYDAMANLEFLPGSPVLMNASTQAPMLSCYVLPIGDSISEIYNSLKYAAMIQKFGGGTGFSFSDIRPDDDFISTSRGRSTGPLSFMEIFDASTEIMKQGGRRRGANMGIMQIDHPNILDFITIKDQGDKLKNFNISVGLTRKFFDALRRDGNYGLINPRNGEVEKEIRARDTVELLRFQAWKNADPGVLFLDRIERKNPTPELGQLKATDSCACMPLLPYEAAPLGSINLARMVKNKEINFEKLKERVHLAVHFLDNVLEMTKYPLKKVEEATLMTRKIGVGVMGFADMLYQLEIPYNSQEGVDTAEKIMKFIRDETRAKSAALAKQRGAFPGFEKSTMNQKGLRPARNATLTAIPPTGSISLIAGVSPSIEPNFAICYSQKILEGEELFHINPYFYKIATDIGFFSPKLVQQIKNKASIQDVDSIQRKYRRVFVLAHDIEPEWHVRIQAAFQKYTDNAVSKTVNLPANATVQDVEKVYDLAYELGCKGITIYRNGSLDEQVINLK